MTKFNDLKYLNVFTCENTGAYLPIAVFCVDCGQLWHLYMWYRRGLKKFTALESLA